MTEKPLQALLVIDASLDTLEVIEKMDRAGIKYTVTTDIPPDTLDRPEGGHTPPIVISREGDFTGLKRIEQFIDFVVT